MSKKKFKNITIAPFIKSITTIHGTSHFSSLHGRSMRAWSCMMAANVVLSIAFILVIKEKFNENQIVTQINANCKVSQVPFPAVTICNFNLVSLRESANIAQVLKKYNRLDSEIEDFFNSLPRLKDYNKDSRDVDNFTDIMKILKHHYFTMDTIMEEVHQKCENLLLYCSFNRKEMKCDNIFSMIKTFEGYCCTFNYAALNDANEVPILPSDGDLEFYDDQNEAGMLQTGSIISTSESGRFYSKFKMPGLLGCVDGTHVAIVCPAQNEERYFNRKGYHSLNVMIICDSNLNIMSVDASYPGSTHDSVVWSNHPICAYLERLHTIAGEDVYLLGDSGYPLRPTLMTPITEPVPGTPESYYQDKHLTARSVVERCIGVLKARFRCLLVDRKMHYAPVAAAKIVNACCVLHNIAHSAHIPYTPLTAEEAARERSLTENASGGGSSAGAAPERRGRHALSLLELGRARQQALIQRLWADRTIMIS